MENDHVYFNKKKRYHTSISYNEQENTNPLELETVEVGDTYTDELNNIPAVLDKIIQNQNNIQKQIDFLRQSYENDKRASANQKQQYAAIEKIMLENLVITKQTFKATQRYFGKNLSELEKEMGAFLPVALQAELDNLEKRFENKTDEEAMKTFLISQKGGQTLDGLMRGTIQDQLLVGFNWDGRCGKKALNQYKLFNKVIREVFPSLDQKVFASQMRKSIIELSHNRAKQRALQEKKSLNQTL